MSALGDVVARQAGGGSALRAWPPPAWRVPLGRKLLRHPPFPLAEPSLQLYAQARQGLRDGVTALGLTHGDEILVPTYHHGSEIEALVAAGLVLRYYEPGVDLQPEPASLERLCGPRTRALHLIHHLGFPQDSARWRHWCDRRGLLLVEDAAQAWLATRDGVPVGDAADLAIFCLYKSLRLPDGAAAVARAPLLPPSRRGASGLLPVLRPLAGRLRRRLRRGPDRPFDLGRDVAVPTRSRGASVLTRWSLPRTDCRRVAAQRREHYRLLLLAFGPWVPFPFDQLPSGASPFVLPVAVQDPRPVLHRLAEAGVHGLDLWRHPHPQVPVAPTGRAAWMRRHVLGLPVHQDLTAVQLQRLVRVGPELLGPVVTGTDGPHAYARAQA